MRAMKVGDLGFFYHSNIGKEVVGIVEVCRESAPDSTTDDPRWDCVWIRAVRPFMRPSRWRIARSAGAGKDGAGQQHPAVGAAGQPRGMADRLPDGGRRALICPRRTKIPKQLNQWLGCGHLPGSNPSATWPQRFSLGDAPAFRQDSGHNPCAQAMGGKGTRIMEFLNVRRRSTCRLWLWRGLVHVDVKAVAGCFGRHGRAAEIRRAHALCHRPDRDDAGRGNDAAPSGCVGGLPASAAGRLPGSASGPS
jgi:hypothetical protein